MSTYFTKKDNKARTTVVAINKQFGGINVKFGSDLSVEEVQWLRDHGYKWRNNRDANSELGKYWYAFYTAERMAELKAWMKAEKLDKDVSFPTVSAKETKEMEATTKAHDTAMAQKKAETKKEGKKAGTTKAVANTEAAQLNAKIDAFISAQLEVNAKTQEDIHSLCNAMSSIVAAMQKTKRTKAPKAEVVAK